MMGPTRLARFLERHAAALGPPPSKYALRKAAAAASTPRSSWPRCAARTRTGKPCKAPPARDTRRDPVCGWYRPVKSGRCRLHGGLSTGPTPEGRRRIAEAARARYDAGVEAQGGERPSVALALAVRRLLDRQPMTHVMTGTDCTRTELRRVAARRPVMPDVVYVLEARLLEGTRIGGTVGVSVSGNHQRGGMP